MKTNTTTNSEPYKNEVKATPLNELKSSSPSQVELYLELSSDAKSEVINVLSWSLGSMNAFCTCTLVNKIIYDVEMTVFWKGSNCLNGRICLLLPWDLDLDLDLLSEEQDEDSLLLWGDHLSFECDLLDLFRCDEDPWDLKCDLLLNHDQCLHLSALLEDLDWLH